MADAPQLDRPGVEVYQEFTSATPTILVPAMPACIVGPCHQVVEAVEDSGMLNSDAILALPARFMTPFITTPFELTGTGGDTLALEINNGAAESIVLPGTNPTLTEVADAINAAEIADLVAEVETSGVQQRLVVRTESATADSSIRIGTATSADVLSTMSITKGYTYYGTSGYMNVLKLGIQFADYPDPRDNAEDLVVDYDTVRVFLNPGTGTPVELLRTEGFLQGAQSAVTVQDDGDGDNLSPYLNFASANFRTAAATMTGTANLSSTFGNLDGDTLILSIDGASAVTTTFVTPANAAAVATQINTAHGATIATVNGSNQLVLTSTTSGVGSSIQRTGGTALSADIGFAVGAYAAGRASKARAQGTSDLTALTYSSGVQSRVLRMSLNGEPYQTLTVSTSTATAAALVAEMVALWGAGVATLNAANNLVLLAPSTFGGTETTIRVDKTASDSTLLTNLGLTTSGGPFETTDVVRGNPMPPIVGDEVWVDGVRLGTITELPTAATNRLRLSAEQLLTFTGSSWYIIAKGLDNAAATSTRPSSNIIVDENTGSMTVRHEIFHTTAGVPVVAGPLSAYLGYTALRKDVTTAKADGDFNLLRIGSLTDLEDQLGPIDTQNPLALGMYFAMLNAPGLEVTGCGVDEVNDSAPEGTLDAYARAFEYLESKGVYAIAPMTHSADVGGLARVHVLAMSEPGNNLERIAILNPERPTRASSTLIAAGATGNVAGAPTSTVETGLANLQALLAAAGVAGPTYDEDDGVYLEFEDDSNKYQIASISNGVVTINNGPLTENDDGFYYDADNTDVFTEVVVDRPFAVKVRGAEVANRTEEAAAYADIARGYLSRRVIVTAPDQAKATLDGLETIVEGYYLAAALAGRKSAKAPQLPLTEDSLAGFTGVVGAQERYSEIQLKIMCGGGLWVFYQEADGQPVRTRHQLTSDVSTLLNREDSITHALDYAAIILRTTLRNFAGRFNITTDLQDALAIVLDGVRDFLLRNGVFAAFDVTGISQNASAPDELDVDVDITTLKPANKIRVTMRAA
jgi:hypothetical protein